jgi:hypothetical protein
VERRVEPVARAVAGEHPAGPVRTVRRRSEPDDDDPRARVAEARDRSAPVALAAIAARWIGRDALAPLDEPRAAAAIDDLRLE